METKTNHSLSPRYIYYMICILSTRLMTLINFSKMNKDKIIYTHHYKKTGLSQRFQKRWDSPKKRWDRVKIPILAFFFPALQTARQ